MSSATTKSLRSKLLARSGRLGLLIVALVCAAVWSLTVGSSALSLSDLWGALHAPMGEERASIIVWQVRLPRLLAGLAAGACFAVAGGMAQAITNNPLADPGLLGVNSGAAFAVVIVLTLTGGMAAQEFVWIAFLGAALTAALVYLLGSIGRGGANPLKLVLAGVIIGSFLISITSGILMIDGQTLEKVRFWTMGSLRNRSLPDVVPLLPFCGAGLIAALLCARQVTALSLGADIAAGLGQNIALWRGLCLAIIVVLAGSAVSVAGPLGFVGLVVPHMVRLSSGSDYRWILPLSAVGGALLVTLGDVLPRALWDKDIPVGVMMSVIGAPFFIMLARGRTRAGRDGASVT